MREGGWRDWVDGCSGVDECNKRGAGAKMGPEGQKNRGDEILVECGEKLVASVVCVSVCLFVQIRAFICMCGSCMRACDCLDVRTKGRPLPFFFFSFFFPSLSSPQSQSWRKREGVGGLRKRAG